tara:strand:+ start:33 stop:398 length:366 start_codon:yes stop_codon:yes gene_type:complete
MANQNGKEKDFVFFPYDPNHEKATKIDFSGNIKLTNGKNATILGSKGSSTDGNHKFIKIFKQVGVLFKGDDNKFTGDINDVEIGGKKALIGWSNEDAKVPNISGYSNQPKEKSSQTNKMNF